MTTKAASLQNVSLEVQILHYRKLHSEALQMVVLVAKRSLSTQNHLLNMAAQLQKDYVELQEFLTEHSKFLTATTGISDDSSEQDSEVHPT